MSKSWGQGLRVLLGAALCALFVFSAWGTEVATPPKVATANSFGGTLFFNGGERAQMDRTRTRSEIDVQFEEAAHTKRTTPSIINGFVKRSDNVTMVWVDEEIQQSIDRATAAQLEPTFVGAPLRFGRASQLEIDGRASSRAQKKSADSRVSNPRENIRKKRQHPNIFPGKHGNARHITGGKKVRAFAE
jgi:hypothetical protein